MSNASRLVKRGRRKPLPSEARAAIAARRAARYRELSDAELLAIAEQVDPDDPSLIEVDGPLPTGEVFEVVAGDEPEDGVEFEVLTYSRDYADEAKRAASGLRTARDMLEIELVDVDPDLPG